MDSIGGGLDAFTSKELVSYNVKVLDEHLPEAFDIVSDLVRNPLFERKDIEKEKGVILEELKMEVDNPEYLIHEIFSSHFWKGHALGRSILGTKQTIRSFDRDLVERYYREFYTPSNILITAAGNLTHRRLMDLVEERFGDLNRGACAKPNGVPRPHAPLDFPQQEFARTGACLHRRAFHSDAPRSRASPSYILNAILGGGMSSRLFQNIREKQGLAYTVYSELAMYHDAGCMLVYAGTSLKSAQQVVKSIVHELSEVVEKRVSDDELRRAKDHLKGSFVLGLESTSSRMGNLARQELYFKPLLLAGRNARTHRESHCRRGPGTGAPVLRSQTDGGGDARTPGRIPVAPWGPDALTRHMLNHWITAGPSPLRGSLGRVRPRRALAVDTTKLKPTGYVNDFAHALDARSARAIEAYCANVERATGAQFAVVVIDSLEGDAIEDDANRLYRQWGVGKKGTDEGLLLMLAIKDHNSASKSDTDWNRRFRMATRAACCVASGRSCARGITAARCWRRWSSSANTWPRQGRALDGVASPPGACAAGPRHSVSAPDSWIFHPSVDRAVDQRRRWRRLYGSPHGYASR